MKNNPTSILAPHYNELMSIPTPEALYSRTMEIVNGSKINPIDKRKMQLDLDRLENNHSKLQYYITNSLLKFSGQGVVKSIAA